MQNICIIILALFVHCIFGSCIYLPDLFTCDLNNGEMSCDRSIHIMQSPMT